MAHRIVFVTGGGSGIGAAVSRAFAADGDVIVAADINVQNAASAVAELPPPAVGEHLAVEMDVASEASVVAAVGQVERDLGPIEALIAAAGIFQRDPRATSVTGNSLEDWEHTEQVNSRGTFVCVREMMRARRVRRAENARVVTFTSIGAQAGVVSANVAYAASKAAVMGITRCAAREGAPLGITANCIAPGYIDTPMLAGAFDDLAAVERTIPVGRLGRPEEVAALTKFLCSVDAGYITGTVIDINGGIRFSG